MSPPQHPEAPVLFFAKPAMTGLIRRIEKARFFWAKHRFREAVPGLRPHFCPAGS